mmetsp:Transcript_35212/g.116693  ORF Transcript_35212/g.116693 Transcript_35212/m.116693 type:complete len:253 (+) Transcript_35212:570-1328(+)
MTTAVMTSRSQRGNRAGSPCVVPSAAKSGSSYVAGAPPMSSGPDGVARRGGSSAPACPPAESPGAFIEGSRCGLLDDTSAAPPRKRWLPPAATGAVCGGSATRPPVHRASQLGTHWLKFVRSFRTIHNAPSAHGRVSVGRRPPHCPHASASPALGTSVRSSAPPLSAARVAGFATVTGRSRLSLNSPHSTWPSTSESISATASAAASGVGQQTSESSRSWRASSVVILPSPSPSYASKRCLSDGALKLPPLA